VSARHKRRGDRAARQAKVRQIADVLREGEPSRFRYEAACRHGLRAKLCLDGWPYHAADQEAHQLVQAALDMLGARRPSWAMGQPEWTQDGTRVAERYRCARCAGPLPEGRWLWCSDACRSAAHQDRARRQNREDHNAKARAYRAAWAAKVPERTCETCGRGFKPKDPGRRPNPRFCSVKCRNAGVGGRKPGFGAPHKG
jgi:predicted nucleic acid-binding Zn ribbon protein